MNLPRYLDINLSTGEIKKYPVSEEHFRKYMGGKALAARILLAEVPTGVDPLGPDNVLIINTGPLTGTGAPASGRFNVTTKNVLTGGIASSNCGGNFGIKLRRAGVDGLVIRGRAEEPVYIEITGGRAHIRAASHLWGMDTQCTQKEFPGEYGKLVIGPAGENLVRYASIVSQERVAGRCGVGAVMGSKNLKAVVAFGVRQVPVASPKALARLNSKWTAAIRKNVLTGQALPRYGTMGFISKGGATGLLPVKNFSQPRFDQVEEISGERYAETLLVRNSGCVGCPIRCERRQRLGDKEIKGPEYETVGILGSNLLNASMEKISHWNYMADLLGLDTISLGGTLGFAMELKERGLADLGVDFSDLESVQQVIANIAFRRGSGDELANGSAWLAEKYGGQEFAPHAKGMEQAAYDPRRSVGLGLGYATANRGACHLNGGYMVFLEVLGPVNIDPQATRAKPPLTVLMQNMMEAISTSGMCLFTSMALFPNSLHKLHPTGWGRRLAARLIAASSPMLKVILRWPGILTINSGLVPYPKALEYVTGIKMNLGRFLQLGERSYNLERLFNIREGLDADDDRLCQRMTEHPQDSGDPRTVVPLDKMLPEYYRCRGWDARGVPAANKLSQLGIEI